MNALGSLIEDAWTQCYLNPLRAREIGHELVLQGAEDLGWFHVALAEIRIGEVQVALDALKQSRVAYQAKEDALGLMLCDEVKAIHLRRSNDNAACRALQHDIDQRPGLVLEPVHRFIAFNSRAMTARNLGDTDESLRLFYAALDAAEQSGLPGLRSAALVNLGGYHLDLSNLEDARILSERAVDEAKAAGAVQATSMGVANLISVYCTMGLHRQALALAEQMVARPSWLRHDVRERFAVQIAQAYLGVGEIDQALAHLQHLDKSSNADTDGVALLGWITARCHLAKGQAAQARRVAEETLGKLRESVPLELMDLHRVAADACEQLGDVAAALAYTQRAQAIYETVVGQSARARYIALQVGQEVARAKSERAMAEQSLARMADLNRALQAKIDETDQLYARLREQALRDPLTGLHNRRYLFEVAPRLIELARRNGTSLCVVQLDLDRFKNVNDTYGHQAGDTVLRRFAELLTQNLRRSDIVCRHGGEEFVAVMPDIDQAGARAVIERLLSQYGNETLDFGTERLTGPSFSAGLAVFPKHGQDLDELLARADQALYQAKERGRARVEYAVTAIPPLS